MVVADDHLQIAIALIEDAGQTPVQKSSVIEVGDDD
jgi:hypothetical protein